MNLDLVITSDTAIAHLAAALGVPVWVALQQSPNFRWLLERDDSPWYASARLFRQSRLGDWGELFTRMALALSSLDKEALARTEFSLGEACQRRKDWARAEQHYRRSVAAMPELPELHNNLGVVLRSQQKTDQAVATFQHALRLRPNFTAALCNLGSAYKSQGKLSQAMQCFDAAIAADPQTPKAHHNRALLRLLTGDFVNGSREYEWRWRVESERHTTNLPRWQGEPVNGSLLLTTERGMGDVIQFIRYAPLTKQRSVRA